MDHEMSETRSELTAWDRSWNTTVRHAKSGDYAAFLRSIGDFATLRRLGLDK